MSDPTPPTLSAPTTIPTPREPWEHPMAPYDGVAHPPPAPMRTVPAEPYAHWGLRVAAAVIDALLQIPFLIAQVVGLVIAFDGGGLTWTDRSTPQLYPFDLAVHQMTTATWVGLAIAAVASMSGSVFSIRNSIFRQGRRGASIGKQCMNLMVVSENDGRPIGAVLTWLRSWVHLIDLVTVGIGYLWPLWDRKRQTFADMVMKTAVLHLPPRTP